MRIVQAAVVLGIVTVSLSGQTVLQVPQGWPTIQAAINAAQNGDTVLVAPGTYMESIDFLGKDISVQSSGGLDLTTIHGDGTQPAVTFASLEPQTATIDGLTVKNGGFRIPCG